QHRFQFCSFELFQERIKQDNLPHPTESGEKRIGMARAFAPVHNLNVLSLKIQPTGQAKESLTQGAFSKRRELIEERQNENRGKEGQQKLKGHDRHPAPHPPKRTSPAEKFEH